MEHQAQGQGSRLLHLPAEVRDNIWRHLLGGTNIVFFRTRRQNGCINSPDSDSPCAQASPSFRAKLFRGEGDSRIGVKLTTRAPTDFLDCPQCLDETPAKIFSCYCAFLVDRMRHAATRDSQSKNCNCPPGAEADARSETTVDMEEEHRLRCSCEKHGALEAPSVGIMLVCRSFYSETRSIFYSNPYMFASPSTFCATIVQPKRNVFSIPRQIEDHCVGPYESPYGFDALWAWFAFEMLLPQTILQHLSGVQSVTLFVNREQIHVANETKDVFVPMLTKLMLKMKAELFLRVVPEHDELLRVGARKYEKSLQQFEKEIRKSIKESSGVDS